MTEPHVPHHFELTLEVPGTAAQVWDAIATARGISAWLMPTELEERAGGAVHFDRGPDGASDGEVTAWEPNRRFAYEEDWASLVGQAGAPVSPLATEFLVEADSGGSCVVRVVTSAMGTGADWENEFWDDMVRGWAPMLDNLRLYLAHFAGRDVVMFGARAELGADPEAVMTALRDGLGAPQVGASVDARGVRGVVERVLPEHLLVRTTEPVAGLLSFFAFGGASDEAAGAAEATGSTVVVLQGHLYPEADDPEAAKAYIAREEEPWTAWLASLDAHVRDATEIAR
ncbi:MAG: SRPBCC domain-containing protein [Actinomycetota bacterium]|nr:SRPBCC domain-containing protein [Actinomycetota bacterium]